MARYKTSELTSGDHTASADVAAVQAGADRRLTVNTAAYKAASASGSGAAGQVPQLDSSGALALADGGTGLKAGPAAAGQYFGTPQGSTVAGFYALPTLSLDDGAVVTAKLADDAVTQAKLADDSVGADQLAAAAVGTAALGADAVTGAKVADDAIDTEHVADRAVVPAQLDMATPSSGDLLSFAVTGGVASFVAVSNTSLSISDGSITTAKLAADAVTAAKIADDAIGAAAIADGAIVAAAFAAGAVGTAALAADCVTSAKIPDGAVDTEHLAADAITGAKIADDAVDTEHLADASVGNAALDAGVPTDGQFLSASVVAGVVTLDWADVPETELDYAARSELRAGSSNTTKVVNPKILAQELSSIRRQFEDLWSGHATTAETAVSGSSQAVAFAPAPSVSVANVASGDCRTITLAATDLKSVSSGCANTPTLTGHTYSHGLTFERASGDRWILGVFLASGGTLATVYRWFRLVSNAWTAASDADRFTYEPLSLADGRWSPVASDAEGRPGQLTGGLTASWIANRTSRWLRFATLRQHGASAWRLSATQRTLGWIEEDIYVSSATGGLTSTNATTNLSSGRKFSSYENLYIVTTTADSAFDYQHGMVSGSIARDNSTEIPCWAGSAGVNVRLNSDTSFFLTSRNTHGLKRIVGRRQFP